MSFRGRLLRLFISTILRGGFHGLLFGPADQRK